MEQESLVVDTAGYPHHARSFMSTVVSFPAEAVWQEIRDFNAYPAYIDGVTESYLEDDMPGDKVGCVRRFVYLGDVTRQKLTGHSDTEMWFSHTGMEALTWPSHQAGGIGPAVYQNRIELTPITDGGQTLLAWSLDFWGASEADAAAWKDYFDRQIPVWATSLRNYMGSLPEFKNRGMLITGLRLKDGVTAAQYEKFALEVDKPTCEGQLQSFASWNVHRVNGLHGTDAKAPYDYIEIVHITDLDQFERDLESSVVAEIGAQAEPLLQEPDLFMVTLVE